MYQLHSDNIDYNNYSQCYSSGQCNLPPSTGTPLSSCFQTSPNSNNVPPLLNNYEENNYCEVRVPSTNIIPNGYSNSEVHSQVFYPGYESCTIEEYNRCNQIGSETTSSTEGFYNLESRYLQDVSCENQVDLCWEKPIYSRNRKISAHNNSLNSRAGMDNIGAKRTRQIYTKHQTKTLEDEFKNNTYINKTRRAELSKHLSLSEKKIKIWFQNRRTKTKKQLTLQ